MHKFLYLTLFALCDCFQNHVSHLSFWSDKAANKAIDHSIFMCVDRLSGGLPFALIKNTLRGRNGQPLTPLRSPLETLRAKIWDSNPIRRLTNFIDKELPFLQFLWPKDNLRLRVYLVMSMVFMFIGKYFNIQVPFMLQRVIDAASKSAGKGSMTAALTRPTASLLCYYGISRALSTVFSEIKTCLFASVSQNTLRRFAKQIFSHLHSLDSDFHWRTPSGTVSVAYVRAVRGFQTMLFQLVFSVAPTALELVMVSTVLFRRCGPLFAGITLATFSFYTMFTIWITEWRVAIRQELVDVDNERNGFFIDSVLNHEVVKLFTNEARETARFDAYLAKIEDLNIQTTYSVAALNLGQVCLFNIGLTASLLLTLRRMAAGVMSVGDLVAVNGLLVQLSVPFYFIGYTYQELRQSYVDIGFMRNVLLKERPTASDKPQARDIEEVAPQLGPSSLEFRDVHYSYNGGTDADGNSASRQSLPGVPPADLELLKGVTFRVNPGENAAIVGPSGSGKSTTLRLITRMLSPQSGAVLVDGVDISDVTLTSIRKRIAVVPQDTSLFDDTVEYNLRYGNANASSAQLQDTISRCNLDRTVSRLADGLRTRVGERGGKLSGGERQKVSIARAILKDPSLILCDEVTSSVDAFAERDIVNTLRQASQSRTTLTVAHRLSSIAHCDRIIVIDGGRVVEQGTHSELLSIPEGMYKRMWEAQNGDKMSKTTIATKTPWSPTSAVDPVDKARES